MAQKILIVEDDSFLQGLAATKLTKEGFAVSAAGTAAEASAKLDADTPDLILLDVILPGGTDGLGILQKIRADAKTSKVPVIMFSNMSDEKNVGLAKALGATDYMVKSNFTLDELADRIKELLK